MSLYRNLWPIGVDFAWGHMSKSTLSAVAVCGVMLFLSACATPSYNYHAVSMDISEPPLNIVSTARVGDNMLQQGKYEEREAIRLDSAIKVGGIGNYTFSPGVYVKTGNNADGDFYTVGSVSNPGHIESGAITDPFQAILVKSDGSTICGVSVFGGKVCKEGVSIKKIKVPNLTTDAFQQTLIYSGRVGDKINIGYREFSGNSARPAFNNDVEYDLHESKTIGYKGAKIEIVDATNEYIKYIVIQNFNRTVQ